MEAVPMSTSPTPEVAPHGSRGWTGVIEAVRTPLGLAALVVLATEAVLALLVSTTAEWWNRTLLIVGMFVTLVLLILVAARHYSPRRGPTVFETTAPGGRASTALWTAITLLLAVLAFSGGFAVGVNRTSKSQIDLNKVIGQIKGPAAGSAVANTVECAGSVEGLQDGVHLWLAVEADGGKGMWPKLPLKVAKDGPWSATVFEDGSSPTFNLSLLAADSTTDVLFKNWLENSRRTNSYESLAGVTGYVRVARVDGLRRKDKP
jgi:hypothetical protein